jgi:hypothetical protein
MFLFGEGSMSRLEQEFIRWLSVAGGFFVGFVVTHILVRILCSFVFKTTPSAKLVQVLRIGGGIAVAIMVYFLLLPSGGPGPGGAGDATLFPNTTNNAQEQPKNQNEEIKKDSPPVSKETLLPSDEVVTVTILSPNVNKKWYRYEKETDPVLEETVLKRISDRDKPGEKPVKVVQIVLGENASAPAAAKLVKRIREMGKKVLTPPEFDELN